jgi:hypothetical protein
MLKLILNEPVMAAILATVAATVALLVAFHVSVTADQREAIEGWVGAVLLLGVAVRSRVTPTAGRPVAATSTATVAVDPVSALPPAV